MTAPDFETMYDETRGDLMACLFERDEAIRERDAARNALAVALIERDAFSAALTEATT